MDRVLKYIDELCEENVINGSEVVAQIGYTNYKPHNYKYFNLIGREDFQKYIEEASVIISHAGTGSVIPPLKMKKKVIVVPRRLKYGEHLDDHQLELADVFSSAGYTLCANDKQELADCIRKMELFQPKEFKSNKKEFNALVIDFIEKM